jgi:hypothetical protein
LAIEAPRRRRGRIHRNSFVRCDLSASSRSRAAAASFHGTGCPATKRSDETLASLSRDAWHLTKWEVDSANEKACATTADSLQGGTRTSVAKQLRTTGSGAPDIVQPFLKSLQEHVAGGHTS